VNQINALAEGPETAFEPHITFLSGYPLDVPQDDLELRIGRGLRAWRSGSGSVGKSATLEPESGFKSELEFRLEEPIVGEKHYTALIYPILQSGSNYTDLIQGRNLLSDTLKDLKPSLTGEGYFPHLSLLYSSKPRSELEERRARFLKEEKLLDRVVVREVVLVKCQGEVDEWTVIRTWSLDGRSV
jgi:hypothetical protein